MPSEIEISLRARLTVLEVLVSMLVTNSIVERAQRTSAGEVLANLRADMDPMFYLPQHHVGRGAEQVAEAAGEMRRAVETQVVGGLRRLEAANASTK